MTTIYEILKKDHETVIGLLDQLIGATGESPKAKESLIKQIRDELIPHARAEEAVLYNSIRDVETASEVVAHAYQEHLEAEAVLRSLQVSDAINIEWVAGAKKLKEMLQHHIEEEEGKVFTAAKSLFTEEEAEAMGEVFQKMKPHIKNQSLLGTSLDMLVNMMPTRLRDRFGKYSFPAPISRAS